MQKITEKNQKMLYKYYVKFIKLSFKNENKCFTSVI